MNTEIYYLCQKKKDSENFNKALPSLIRELKSKEISVLYKTDIDFSAGKILSALKKTEKGLDDVKTVFILGGLGKTDRSPVITAFNKLHAQIGKDSGLSPKQIKEKKPEIYSLGDMGNGYHACFMLYNGKMLVALPKSSLSGASDEDMLKLTIERLSDSKLIECREEDRTENGYAYFTYKKTGVSMLSWKYYIPVKGDGIAETARKLLFLAAIVTICISGYKILDAKLLEPALVEKTYNDIKDIYYNSTDTDYKIETTSDITAGEAGDDVLTSFKALISVNDDVQGWIYVPNTKSIDYPVMQSKGDSASYQKYLYKDFNGNYSNYGSIFIDYRSNQGTNSKNVILHGHNTGTSMMFTELCNYKNLSFYKSSPTVTFSSRTETNEYVVFAAFLTSTLSEHGTFFNYLKGSFSNDSEFMNYIYQCRARSLINTPVTVNQNDQILTLSTCTYEYEGFRMVVMARKVRDYEKTNGFSFNTDYAYYNSNPLYPTVWYQDKGGTPPATTTFERVYNNGGIPWYDGSGISGTPVDPGIFYINDNPDYNEMASSKPAESEKPSDTGSTPDQIWDTDTSATTDSSASSQAAESTTDEINSSGDQENASSEASNPESTADDTE